MKLFPMLYKKNSLLAALGCILLVTLLFLRPHQQPTAASIGAKETASKTTDKVVSVASKQTTTHQKTLTTPPVKAGPVVEVTAEDEAIAAILTTPNADPRAIIDQFLTLLPTLSEDGQHDVASHIVNLSDDQDAARWTAALLEGSLPAPAAEVFFKDLSNRPVAIALPAFAAMADNPRHPHTRQSADTLSLLLGPLPKGLSWSKWLRQSSSTGQNLAGTASPIFSN